MAPSVCSTTHALWNPSASARRTCSRMSAGRTGCPGNVCGIAMASSARGMEVGLLSLFQREVLVRRRVRIVRDESEAVRVRPAADAVDEHRAHDGDEDQAIDEDLLR